MIGGETLRRINAKKYAVAVHAARPGEEPQVYHGLPVFVNKDLLVVGYENETACPVSDASVLTLRGNGDGDFYINHTAGFQRWHTFHGSRLEALGYAKQIGVTDEQFTEAFGPHPEGFRADALIEADATREDLAIEVEG